MPPVTEPRVENPKVQSLWDEFLRRWPIEALETMTLEQYSAAGQTDTFTYWLEFKLEDLGMIAGSSAFKFGIYNRKNQEPKKSDSTYTYEQDYAFYSWLGTSAQEAFETVRRELVYVARAARQGDLEKVAAASTLSNLMSLIKWKVAFLYQDRDKPICPAIYSKDFLCKIAKLSSNASHLDVVRALMQDFDPSREGIYDFSCRLWTHYKQQQGAVDMELDTIDEIVALLQKKKNLILQGAPGTGKTYRVPEIVTRLCGCTKPGDTREMIMDAYRNLKSEGRVAFTTFHPSLDYENFVQGWQPRGDGDDEGSAQIQFEIYPGIFKRIADRAALGIGQKDDPFKSAQGAPQVWKVSLGGNRDNPIRKDCLNNNRIRIDYGITSEQELQSVLDGPNEKGHRACSAFCDRMKQGDIVVSCYTSTQTDAIGIVEGDVTMLSDGDGGLVSRAVRWLWRGEPTDISQDFLDGYVMTQLAVYGLTHRFSPLRVREFLEKKNVLPQTRTFPPFVLVIDEINRGNIAKIFGELITLLESDKRKGEADEQSCQLPISKENFTVPSNLYIIGTMNTADRSIGTIDYALRRRFVFYPLKPEPIDDPTFDKELFDAVSGLFVESTTDAQPKSNRKTLAEDFDCLDVWIGSSYFLMQNQDRRERYRYEIRPLLMQYLRDGVFKPAAEEEIQKMEAELGL